jgi:hypothetical protein
VVASAALASTAHQQVAQPNACAWRGYSSMHNARRVLKTLTFATAKSPGAAAAVFSAQVGGVDAWARGAGVAHHTLQRRRRRVLDLAVCMGGSCSAAAAGNRDAAKSRGEGVRADGEGAHHFARHGGARRATRAPAATNEMKVSMRRGVYRAAADGKCTAQAELAHAKVAEP